MNQKKRPAKRIGQKSDLPKKHIEKVYHRTRPKSDYLKYWRVIKHWFKKRYSLSTDDMDILLFLYTEDYFSTDQFEEFNNVIGWDRERFYRMHQQGWISTWREKTPTSKALYEISRKGRMALNALYKKLEGDPITEIPQKNRLFLKEAGYVDRKYREYIKKLNADSRRQRRPSLE